MKIVFLVDVPPGCTEPSGITYNFLNNPSPFTQVSPKQHGTKRYRIEVDIPPNDETDQVIVASAEVPGSFKASGVKDETPGS